MTSILDHTGDPEAERLIMSEPERPGSWFGDEGADGRMLTQEQTDGLIRSELWFEYGEKLPEPQREEFRATIGGTGWWSVDPAATLQRGGIDSDPLVRVLAFRAWGDRDRLWFEERGVRKGERVVHTRDGDAVLAWAGEWAGGRVDRDARPGESVCVDNVHPRGTLIRIGDRLREPPADAPQQRYGFSRFWSERDVARRATSFFAERARIVAVRIVTDEFERDFHADLQEAVCAALDRQLTAMGAPRTGAISFTRSGMR